MANNKKDPPSWLRSLFGGIGKDYKGDVGKMGRKGPIIGGLGALGVGVGMGVQSRQKKKKAFLNEKYPGQNYDKKKMKDEFKSFRKGMDEMKVGGTTNWTRKSKVTDYNGKKGKKGKK